MRDNLKNSLPPIIAYVFMNSCLTITGAVTCIKVRKNDRECVSASSDGTCIIWDLV